MKIHELKLYSYTSHLNSISWGAVGDAVIEAVQKGAEYSHSVFGEKDNNGEYFFFVLLDETISDEARDYYISEYSSLVAGEILKITAMMGHPML